MNPLFPKQTRFLALAVCLLGCDPDNDDGADEANDQSGTEGDELITNACGTFDPNEPGDSVIPQDPDDPEIITACMALCEVQVGIEDCTFETAPCLEHCKMRSCAICPDTLAPLVDCETAMFTGENIMCVDGRLDSAVPAGCSDLEDQTGFCGG